MRHSDGSDRLAHSRRYAHARAYQLAMAGLAAGKMQILGGQAGTGKTTIALALGATLTICGCWPDGSKVPVGNLVIWSGLSSWCWHPAPSPAGATRARLRCR